MRIVPAHAHHLIFMIHFIGWIRYLQYFSSQKKRTNQLSFRRYHAHAPGFFGYRRNGEEVILFQKGNRFVIQFQHGFGLLSFWYKRLFYFFLCLFPIFSKAHLTRSLEKLSITPGKFFVG